MEQEHGARDPMGLELCSVDTFKYHIDFMRFRVCAQDEIRQHMVLVSVAVNTSLLPSSTENCLQEVTCWWKKNDLFIGNLLKKPNLKSKSDILESIKDARLIPIKYPCETVLIKGHI